MSLTDFTLVVLIITMLSRPPTPVAPIEFELALHGSEWQRLDTVQ